MKRCPGPNRREASVLACTDSLVITHAHARARTRTPVRGKRSSERTICENVKEGHKAIGTNSPNDRRRYFVCFCPIKLSSLSPHSKIKHFQYDEMKHSFTDRLCIYAEKLMHKCMHENDLSGTQSISRTLEF